MKQPFFILLFIFFLIPGLYPAQEKQDPSLYPEFFFPYNRPFFHLWGNPAYLSYNDKLTFHTNHNISLYTSLLKLVSVLNGDYDLIAYWIDQLSAGGYGAGLSWDIGIEGKYWSAGFNTNLDLYSKGPAFPEVSYGKCVLTASLYAGFAYPFTINDFDISVGITLMPLYRLKIPVTTGFNKQILVNIIEWLQESIKTLLKDIYIYQGLGFGINSTLLVQYNDISLCLLLDNIFNTHIYYKKYDLGIVAEDPGVLFGQNDDPVDHVGIIPMDLSLTGTYTIRPEYKIIREIEMSCGFYHIIEFITDENTNFTDLIYLQGKIISFSFVSLVTSLYKGSFYLDLICSFPTMDITASFFCAIDDRVFYAGPKEALALGFSLHY